MRLGGKGRKVTLTLVRGLPGSGKSTFVKRNFSCLHLENDMFHMHDGKYEFDGKAQNSAVAWCTDMARAALELGMDVVVSNTFVRKRYVEAYRKIAEETGARFEVFRCSGNFGNVHDVPKDVLESMKAGFEDWEGEMLT